MLQATHALCSSLLYIYLPELWWCLALGFFLMRFCQISVQFLEALKFQKKKIKKVFLLPVVETGLNTRPVPSFSVWFHSHLFIIPLLLVQKDCSITHPLPCSLLSTEALIFFPLFSFPPQPLSCLLASPFLLFCRMITPCAACPSSVSSSSYLISVI